MQDRIYETGREDGEVCTRPVALAIRLSDLLDPAIPTDWPQSLCQLWAECEGDLDRLYRTLTANTVLLAHRGRCDLAQAVATDLLALMRAGAVQADRRGQVAR